MSFAAWLQTIKSAEKTSLMTRDVRKVHYKLADGREMAEEYNLSTGVIVRRAWRHCNGLTKGPEAADWQLELGDVVRPLNPDGDQFVVKESVSEPILSKRVTKLSLEWRIRNLPYPLETYSVQPAEGLTDRGARRYELIVRTTNRKYYKVIPVVELERCETLPLAAAISLQHQHNTLIITYKKPHILLEMERAVLLVLQDVETERDLDTDCNDLMQRLMAGAKGGAGDA